MKYVPRSDDNRAEWPERGTYYPKAGWYRTPDGRVVHNITGREMTDEDRRDKEALTEFFRRVREIEGEGASS